jgi:pimeloyl-ACP methyl ester carboxylesterase
MSIAKPKWLQLGLCALVLAAASTVPGGSPQAAVNWNRCDAGEFAAWFTSGEPPADMQCGYVSAPLAYDGSLPERTVRLAVTRLPALGERAGSLVFISGGPGIAGIESANGLSEAAYDWLRRRYDLIGYDPRGVGQSTPAIRCSGKEQSAHIGDRSRALASMRKPEGQAETQVRDFVLDCTEYTGLDVLQHLGTREATEDLERLRESLEEPQLNTVAYSYGTKVAANYAERYPQKVRAMVLDGVVDLSETPAMMWIGQAKGYQQAFESFTAYCAKSKSCPLPVNPQKAVKKFQAMQERLRIAPLQGKGGDQLNGEDLQAALMSGMLWSEDWPGLVQALADVWRGSPHRMLAQLASADDYQAAMTVINCTDDAPGNVRRSVLKRQKDQLNKAAPIWGLSDTSLEACDFWPLQGTSPAHVPLVSSDLPPLLFVAQRHDPATPYLNARRMATYFESPLVTRESDGHTLALNGLDECVDAAVLDYLKAPRRAREDLYCKPSGR